MSLAAYALVRVVRLPDARGTDEWRVDTRAPGIGDRGTVVDVLRAPDRSGEALVVESSDSDGSTAWLATFAPDQLAPFAVHPFEPLELTPMASGRSSLALGRDVPLAAFAAYAESVAERLAAGVTSRGSSPIEPLWTLERDQHELWLGWEDHGPGGQVSLDPCDDGAAALLPELRAQLRATRPAMDVRFRVRARPDGRPALATGCAELDLFLGNELGLADDPDDDEESLTLELARQIGALRAGHVPLVRNGSDAVFVELGPEAAVLEYALPNAPRPGVRLAPAVFNEIFVRWFESVNPPLGRRVRQLVWPVRHPPAPPRSM